VVRSYPAVTLMGLLRSRLVDDGQQARLHPNASSRQYLKG
jgi:hypothetical protein